MPATNPSSDTGSSDAGAIDGDAIDGAAPAGSTAGLAFPRRQRLTRGSELELVRHRGKRTRTASLEVRAIASLRAYGRIGFIVPRYKHSAVDRNRLKRRLREFARLEMLPTLPAIDVVLRVFPAAYTRSWDALCTELRAASQQLARMTLPPPAAP